MEYIFLAWLLIVAFIIWAYKRGTNFRVRQIVSETLKQIYDERYGADVFKVRLEAFLAGEEMHPNTIHDPLTVDELIERCKENGVEHYLKLDNNDNQKRLILIIKETLLNLR